MLYSKSRIDMHYQLVPPNSTFCPGRHFISLCVIRDIRKPLRAFTVIPLKSTFSAQQFRRWQCGPIFIRLAVVASQKCQVAQNSEKIWTYISSRSSKVDDFGTNRTRICDFLFVISSNFGSIIYIAPFLRYGDLAENCVFFLPLSYSTPPLLMFPLEFHREVKRH